MEPCVANDEVSDCLCRSCRLHSDLARVTDERDSLRSEVARLTAEVEAMRDLETAARREMWQSMNLPIRQAIEHLDALRARKVGE